ncbi:fatty acid--CoA ligase family protein [Erysipelotrichia bacterium]
MNLESRSLNLFNKLVSRLKDTKDKEALVWRDTRHNFQEILDKVMFWREATEVKNIPSGGVVLLDTDFSPNGIAIFFALAVKNCIIVPLSPAARKKADEFSEIAQIEYSIRINSDDQPTIASTGKIADSELYIDLRNSHSPGLVLFSSGSTGQSKAAVHNLFYLLEKFDTPRTALRTICFLLFDHIGGLNTLLHTFFNGGCLITVQGRMPDEVLAAVQNYKVELLPVSPTFINLILISEAYKKYDLTSLKIVSYGTEAMPELTLKRFNSLFPGIKLLQTYGLSEIGIMRSKSESSDSLWVKLGGEGFETRVVDGLLEIKARSAMLGYLNAASPFSEDGWFKTGDAVEQKGEFFRILGRKSELINVGGEKVFPAEVESVLLEIENVAEAAVYSEKHPLVGQIVCARITPKVSEDPKTLVKRIKIFCREKLQQYKIPVKIQIVSDNQYNERFKTIRKA